MAAAIAVQVNTGWQYDVQRKAQSVRPLLRGFIANKLQQSFQNEISKEIIPTLSFTTELE